MWLGLCVCIHDVHHKLVDILPHREHKHTNTRMVAKEWLPGGQTLRISSQELRHFTCLIHTMPKPTQCASSHAKQCTCSCMLQKVLCGNQQLPSPAAQLTQEPITEAFVVMHNLLDTRLFTIILQHEHWRLLDHGLACESSRELNMSWLGMWESWSWLGMWELQRWRFHGLACWGCCCARHANYLAISQPCLKAR